MSWVEQVKTQLIITTGDGEKYTPLWMNARKEVAYNVAEFEFPEVAGTLVKRRLPKGARYALEIYFQGDNHLDIARAFEASANDPRSWTISHPYFESITIQPTALTFDYTAYNVSKITGTIIETITEDYPQVTTDPIDKIAEDKATFDSRTEETFANTVTPTVTDKVQMGNNNTTLYNQGRKKVKLTAQAQAYSNFFSAANATVINAASEPLAAIRAVNALITYPALFEDTVQNRFSLLINQFNAIRNGRTNAVTPNEKKIYQVTQSMVVAAMAASTGTPLADDYSDADLVLAVIQDLLDTYNTLIADLDDLQTDNGGSINSYVPDHDSIASLTTLVKYAVANLFNIASNARQQRTILLEADSNIILLTHRFYGLDAADANLQDFMKLNQISLRKMLLIRKGEPVKYYVQ